MVKKRSLFCGYTYINLPNFTIVAFILFMVTFILTGGSI